MVELAKDLSKELKQSVQVEFVTFAKTLNALIEICIAVFPIMNMKRGGIFFAKAALQISPRDKLVGSWLLPDTKGLFDDAYRELADLITVYDADISKLMSESLNEIEYIQAKLKLT